MTLEFHEHQGTYTGTAQGGRRWRITRSPTGWRLEFLDPGDSHPTNAGNHRSLEAAKLEASR